MRLLPVVQHGLPTTAWRQIEGHQYTGPLATYKAMKLSLEVIAVWTTSGLRAAWLAAKTALRSVDASS